MNSSVQLTTGPLLVPKRDGVSERDRAEVTAGDTRDFRAEIGRAVGRALRLADLTVKEAAAAMGMADHAQLSRWMAGTDRPLLDRLFAVPALRSPLVIALAELVETVEVETVIRARRA